MASRSLQMLVLVGVACLLVVGQGQAAHPEMQDPNEDEDPDPEWMCAPKVAQALSRAAVPTGVEMLVQESKRVKADIFSLRTDQQIRRYQRKMRGKDTGDCETMMDRITATMLVIDSRCEDMVRWVVRFDYTRDVLRQAGVPELMIEAIGVCDLVARAIFVASSSEDEV
jgi:hypothetical protein